MRRAHVRCLDQQPDLSHGRNLQTQRKADPCRAKRIDMQAGGRVDGRVLQALLVPVCTSTDRCCIQLSERLEVCGDIG